MDRSLWPNSSFTAFKSSPAVTRFEAKVPEVVKSKIPNSRFFQSLGKMTWDRVNVEQGFITLTDTKNHERRDLPMDEMVKLTLKGMRQESQ